MRDPELVFNAQLAASALERAWQHWRVNHGLPADPMPAVSSYVGYSLEEPWGQPRVVFGLAAADAEQLAALLERQDFAGTEHAMTVVQPGSRELLTGADGTAGRPLPVPPQVPSRHADDQDGPVYRQLAAVRAARDAAAVNGLSEPKAADHAPAEVQQPEVQDREAQEPQVQESVGSDSHGDRDGRSDDAEDTDDAKTASRTSDKSRNSRTADRAGPSQDGGPSGRSAADRRAGARKARSRRAGAGRDADHKPIADVTVADAPARVADSVAQEAVPGYDEADADVEAAGQTAHKPGPLALAASAARVAAEARIRAAAQKATPTALDHPRAGDGAERTDPGTEPAGGRTNVRAADASAADGDQVIAASGESKTVAGPGLGDVAAVWGGPRITAGGAEEPEVVRFWPRSEPAAYAEGDPEPGRAAAEPQGYPQASYAKRNRIARGYSIPRLSKAKRPGAVPGS